MDTHNDLRKPFQPSPWTPLLDPTNAVNQLRLQFDDQDAAFTLGYFTGLLKQAAELSPDVLTLVSTHTAILKKQAQ